MKSLYYSIIIKIEKKWKLQIRVILAVFFTVNMHEINILDLITNIML